MQRFFSSSSSSCLRTVRSRVTATATPLLWQLGTLEGSVGWQGMGRKPGRRGRLDSPLIPLSRRLEGEGGPQGKSRGSPEPPLQTGEVDFSKCAKASVPCRQYCAHYCRMPCVGQEGRGLLLFREMCRMKKYIEAFAFAFPATLSAAPVLSALPS